MSDAYHYFFKCAYIGTNYAGSQIQKNAPTVADVVMRACQTLFKRDFVYFSFASRTDAGVHALANRGHLVLQKEIPTRTFIKVMYSLNALLPRDINVYHLQNVRPNAQVRYDAILRSYIYRLHTAPTPFYHQRSLLYPHTIRWHILAQMATTIIGIHDFSSFSKQHISGKSRICKVYFCGWHKVVQSVYGQDGFYFEIGANRFLRGMVRALVGTMLWVDRKGGSVADFQALLRRQVVASAPAYAPSCGLYLQQVDYHSDIFISK